MLASPRRLSLPLLSCLVLVLIAVFSGPASAAPDYSTIKINEVRSENPTLSNSSTPAQSPWTSQASC